MSLTEVEFLKKASQGSFGRIPTNNEVARAHKLLEAHLPNIPSYHQMRDIYIKSKSMDREGIRRLVDSQIPSSFNRPRSEYRDFRWAVCSSCWGRTHANSQCPYRLTDGKGNLLDGRALHARKLARAFRSAPSYRMSVEVNRFRFLPTSKNQLVDLIWTTVKKINDYKACQRSRFMWQQPPGIPKMTPTRGHRRTNRGAE